MMEGDRFYGCDPARGDSGFEALVEITERSNGVYEVTGCITLEPCQGGTGDRVTPIRPDSSQ